MTKAQDILEPSRPHDDLPFEKLGRRCNFRLTSDRRRVCTRRVIKECQARLAPVRVLDVDRARGIGRQPDFQRAIRSAAHECWGLEPDTALAAPKGLVDQYQHAMMAAADLPADALDVV